MPTLVFSGGHAIEIPFNDWFFLGHFPSQDIVLAARTVSGRHAALRCALDGAVTICDLCSANGTYVDGRRIRGSVTVGGLAFVSIGPDVHLRIEAREREQEADGTWHPGRTVPQSIDQAAAAAIRLRAKGVVAALHQHFEAMFPDAMARLDDAFERHAIAIAPALIPAVPYAPADPGHRVIPTDRTTAPGRVWSLPSQ